MSITNSSPSTFNDKNSTPFVSFVPPKTIVLVGLMGCGKSSIGKRLAKRFDVPFFDSDTEVEQAAGCPLADIDSLFGDGALEAGEYRVIDRLLHPPVKIVATGCFSFINPNVQKLIQDKAISVWLRADLETLYQRVSGRKDRPTLEPGQEMALLSDMIDEYYPVLENADIAVQTNDESTNLTVDRVIVAISNYIKENYPDYHVLKSV